MTISNQFLDKNLSLPPVENLFQKEPSIQNPDLATFVPTQNIVSSQSSSDIAAEQIRLKTEQALAERNRMGKELFLAIENDQEDQVTILLQADPTLVHFKDKNQNTPLHRAALFLRKNMIHLLCKNGANINEKNSDGMPPFFLLFYEQTRQNKHKLRPSTEDQLKELIEVFNARGASLHIRDKYHYTAFMVAVDEHCNVILSFLLDDLQFDIREKDMIDRPVFAIAILTDNSYAIDLLIKRGINPNEKIKIKWNCYITKEMLPLQLAINHIKKNSTKQLLQSGVSIEKNKKFDPVFDATSKKCLEIVRDLLAKGASSKTVVKGLTPYLNALYLGQSDIANLLEKHEEGFSEHFIQMKMLDLRFGLGATIRLSEHDIKSSGLVHSLGQKRIFPMFVNSLTQFLSSLSLSFWNDEKTKQLVSAFMHAPNYDLRNLLPYEQDPILQAWKRDELIAASAGWGNHHACMAIYGNLLAKANRGSGCGDFPGAVVYKMKKPLSSEALCALFSQKDSTGFTKKIDKLLELEQVAYLPLPEQDKSNCPWASTEALLLASIFLSLYEENSGKPLEEYIDQSKQLFDLWLKFDHTFGITHYLNFAPHNSTPPDLIFLAKVLAVYQEKDVVRDQLFDFLVQKNVDWNAQDSNGNSALHAAALKNHPEFIVFLKSKKINLNVNLQNSKGETPLHIACQKGYLPMIKMLIENGY